LGNVRRAKASGTSPGSSPSSRPSCSTGSPLRQADRPG